MKANSFPCNRTTLFCTMDSMHTKCNSSIHYVPGILLHKTFWMSYHEPKLTWQRDPALRIWILKFTWNVFREVSNGDVLLYCYEEIYKFTVTTKSLHTPQCFAIAFSNELCGR